MTDGFDGQGRGEGLPGGFADREMMGIDEYGGADEPAELGDPFWTLAAGHAQAGATAGDGPAQDSADAAGGQPGQQAPSRPDAPPQALTAAQIGIEGELLDGHAGTPDRDDAEEDQMRDQRDDYEELQPLEDREGEGGEPVGLDDIDPRDRRGAWVEIDTRALVHNIDEFKKRVGPRVRIMAVVKADAYGHGAVEVSKVAVRAGASWLGVATVDEAIELRQAGISEPILVLSQPPTATIPALVHYGIAPSVYSVEFAMELGEYAAERGRVADYHLCINTGMNRIGVWYDDVADFMALISFHMGLNLQGTFTHFATADAHEDYMFKLQLRRFKEALAQLKGVNVNPGVVHCANSAAAIRYKDSYFDMVRVGISLYGLHPSTVTRRMIELWPVMSVHARVTAVNDVPVGEGVGYSMSYRSPGNVRVCTLPIGYADGLSRQLSNRMNVIYKSKFFPQVGNICMDQCMFEVDKRSTLLNPAVDPTVGDEVIIVGRAGDYILHLDDMADALGTINYELACRFGMRLPRIYI